VVDSGAFSEDKIGDSNVDNEEYAHEVSMGAKSLLVTALNAVRVTLWQRTCLHFLHSLTLCGGLRLG
jgi:hypothetical protein